MSPVVTKVNDTNYPRKLWSRREAVSLVSEG